MGIQHCSQACIVLAVLCYFFLFAIRPHLAHIAPACGFRLLEGGVGKRIQAGKVSVVACKIEHNVVAGQAQPRRRFFVGRVVQIVAHDFEVVGGSIERGQCLLLFARMKRFNNMVVAFVFFKKEVALLHRASYNETTYTSASSSSPLVSLSSATAMLGTGRCRYDTTRRKVAGMAAFVKGHGVWCAADRQAAPCVVVCDKRPPEHGVPLQKNNRVFDHARSAPRGCST